MKIPVIFLMVLFLVSCKSIKDRQPEIYSFQCELTTEKFADETKRIISFGGFEVLEESIKDSNYLIVAQKFVTRSGSGNNQISTFDQIRIRYSELDHTVWVSNGLLTKSSKTTKYTTAPAGDANRHKESVQITIDRIFMLCNPGQFPNRP